MGAYVPPSGSLDPNAPYVGKNLAAGTQGSRVPRLAVEMPLREIANAVALSGQTSTNDDLTQLWQAMQRAAQAAARSTTNVITALTAFGLTQGRLWAQSTPGSYTFPVPANTYKIYVPDCIGGGGGGGGADAVTSGGSAGGGAGNAQDGVYDVTPNEVLTLVIGAGGAPGANGSSPTAGAVGGTSYIMRSDGTVLCSASGGGGGQPGQGGLQSLTRGVGGAAAGGRRNSPGAGGGFPIMIGSTLILGGIGGYAPRGGPSPQINASAGGLAGTPDGGGANGSSANAAGGRGGDGFLHFFY